MNIFKKIKNSYYHYKFKLEDFFYRKSYIYIEFNIFKIFRYWWKVRKIFYKPILKKYKLNINDGLGSDYLYLEYECNNKWLYFAVHPCEFKLKYNEVRFESVPYICLIWKNKIKYIWGLEAPLYEDNYFNGNHYISRNNLLYWEGILTYLIEFNKDIIKTYKNNVWIKTLFLSDIDKETNKSKKYEINYTLINVLKPKYASKIIKYINEQYKNTIQNS